MITDTEIKREGLKALSQSLGQVEAERFITLLLREPFDYAQWQETLFEGKSIEEISNAASALREKRPQPKAD